MQKNPQVASLGRNNPIVIVPAFTATSTLGIPKQVQYLSGHNASDGEQLHSQRQASLDPSELIAFRFAIYDRWVDMRQAMSPTLRGKSDLAAHQPLKVPPLLTLILRSAAFTELGLS